MVGGKGRAARFPLSPLAGGDAEGRGSDRLSGAEAPRQRRPQSFEALNPERAISVGAVGLSAVTPLS